MGREDFEEAAPSHLSFRHQVEGSDCQKDSLHLVQVKLFNMYL